MVETIMASVIRGHSQRRVTQEYVEEAETLLKKYMQEPTTYNAVQWAKWMISVCLEGDTFDPRVKASFVSVAHIVGSFKGRLKDAIWSVLVTGHFHEVNTFSMPRTSDVMEALQKDVWSKPICVEMDADWRKGDEDEDYCDIQDYYWDEIVSIAQ